MYPYFFTLAFLTLMSIAATQTFQRAEKEFIETSMERGALLSRESVQFLKTEGAFESLKVKKSSTPKNPPPPINPPADRPPPPLDFCKTRPPNNARLNIYSLLMDQTPESNAHFHYFEALLDLLYGDHLPPGFLKRLLYSLKEHQSIIEGFTLPDQLATLQIQDMEVHLKLVEIFQGKYGPSILRFINLDPSDKGHHKKMSFLYCPDELLQAICPSHECFSKLLALKSETWAEIENLESHRLSIPRDKWKGRAILKNELSEKYDQLAHHHPSLQQIKKEFEFSLGKKGDIAFLYNSITGGLTREIIIRR